MTPYPPPPLSHVEQIFAALEYFRLHPDETKCCPEDEPLTLEIVSIEELPPHIQHLLP